MSTKISVQIFGEAYNLNGDCKADTLLQVASLVDLKMRKIAEDNPRMPLSRVAVLAGLNIAEDYVRLEHDYQNLLKMLSDVREQSYASQNQGVERRRTGVTNTNNQEVRVPEMSKKK